MIIWIVTWYIDSCLSTILYPPLSKLLHLWPRECTKYCHITRKMFLYIATWSSFTTYTENNNNLYALVSLFNICRNIWLLKTVIGNFKLFLSRKCDAPKDTTPRSIIIITIWFVSDFYNYKQFDLQCSDTADLSWPQRPMVKLRVCKVVN